MALDILSKNTAPLLVAGTPTGFDAKLLTDLAARVWGESESPVIFVARDDARLAATLEAVKFFAPDLDVLTLPAWDCLPYDRVGPSASIMATRMKTLSQLVHKPARKPRLVLTTVNGLAQKLPPRADVKKASLGAAVGDVLEREKLISFLSENGYNRTSQVFEPGEFAVRGNLIDLFPPGADNPLRLDFFGDELDTIREFDAADQRTTGPVERLDLNAAGELRLNEASIKQFQRRYVAEFGPAKGADPLYEAIKEGRKLQGAEHWLPFFYEELEQLTDYLPSAKLVFDHQADEAAHERFTSIDDYFGARKEALELAKTSGDKDTPVYKPVPAETFFLSEELWKLLLERNNSLTFSPFASAVGQKSVDMEARTGRNFSPERQNRATNIYDSVTEHVNSLQKAGKRVIFACHSAGSAERMRSVLEDHGLTGTHFAEDWPAIRTSPANGAQITVLGIETGFETPNTVVIAEQDILGDRLVRSVKRRKKAETFITQASSLTIGDHVVHTSHGIGRFDGLKTLEVSGARHDCLLIVYAGGDKLFVPVENIEVLSRFGGDDALVQLDKLGGVAWQARKARMKERIKEIAEGLMKLAAERALKKGQPIETQDGLYSEFCARFPYTETDDQLRAIGDVTKDLASGKPMDRLICGDVGFGKTEVAMRAAFLTVMAGHQVAIVAPTTLLARQHYLSFKARFAGLPVKVRQLSRLVSSKDAKATKAEMTNGTVDIVIGTHALLAKDIAFNDLALLVVDEEQHFGVSHKEKLKALKSNVHVLTLSATPIPRTLQMAMSGIRDLSLITTPPVDRLAVRTYVTPFDHVVIREALLREHYRGGQSFYVVPRIKDLDEVSRYLKEHIPEVKYVVAHGQMAAGEIERVMTAFYEGEYDVLLSTTIIESGIDIPSANTLIVHRADMFGLSQLYQLRGRVGRSKIRAYAYLTKPANRLLGDIADKRLHVLQTLDTLGAGFSIASHDMDIRGAGNLLGDEQSGHVKEVGVELYQKMLEEAVAKAKSGAFDADDTLPDTWSPNINLGATVMIPDSYVSDLDQRMGLYRRLADLESREDVDGFLAELIDRFGPLPGAVKQLGAIMIIKGYAKRAGIEKVEAGPKGLVLGFRDGKFANPSGLVQFISTSGASAKLRPDHSLVYYARMDKTAARLKTAAIILRKLASLAEQVEKAA